MMNTQAVRCPAEWSRPDKSCLLYTSGQRTGAGAGAPCGGYRGRRDRGEEHAGQRQYVFRGAARRNQ